MTNKPLTPETLESVKRVAEACGWGFLSITKQFHLVENPGCWRIYIDANDTCRSTLILFLHRCYPVLRERGVWREWIFAMFDPYGDPDSAAVIHEGQLEKFLTNPIGQLKVMEEVLCPESV